MGGAAPLTDRVLGSTRAGLVVLLVLAIANGAFLYLFPSQAEPDYAWAIAPPVSAAYIGAGYLAGALASALALNAGSFASIRPLAPALFVLSIVLLAATLIDADRFRWDYPATWLWTAVYAGVPLGILYLWTRQTRIAGAAARPGRGAPGSLRAVSIALGAVLVLIAIILFLAPQSLLDDWPWAITPLMSRVFAGWFALAGVILIYPARTIARPNELVIGYATVAAWSLLALLLPLLYDESMRTSGSAYWPWIALHLVVVAGCAWALVHCIALMRSSGERL